MRPEHKYPIHERIIEARNNFMCQYGNWPTRLELGQAEWAELEVWIEYLKNSGYLNYELYREIEKDGQRTYLGMALHKHVRRGLTARQ